MRYLVLLLFFKTIIFAVSPADCLNQVSGAYSLKQFNSFENTNSGFIGSIGTTTTTLRCFQPNSSYPLGIYVQYVESVQTGSSIITNYWTEYYYVTTPCETGLDENGTCIDCTDGTWDPVTNTCQSPCLPVPGKTPTSLSQEQCQDKFYFNTGYVFDLEWNDCDSLCYGIFAYCPQDQYMNPDTKKCTEPSAPECNNVYSKSMMLVDPQTGNCINKISFYCDDVLFSEYTLSCGNDPTDSNSYEITDINVQTSADGIISDIDDSEITSTIQKSDGTTVTTTTTTTQNSDGSITTNMIITTTYPDGTSTTETQTTTTTGDGKQEISIDLKPVTDRLDLIASKMDDVINVLSGSVSDTNNSNYDEYGICKTCFLGWHPTSDGNCQSDTWPFHTMDCPFSSDSNITDSNSGSDSGTDDQNTTTDGTFDSSGLDQIAQDLENSRSSLVDFIESLQSKFQQIEIDINNTMSIFNDKPSFNMSTTQSCSYTSSLMGRNYTIDLCKYVSPYSSTISIVFTVVGCFLVLIFATKYLVSGRGE